MRLVLLNVFLLACQAPAAPCLAAEITACRVGFDGAYKLGCWTPVRVEVNGVGELDKPRLEVIAPDGDGAPVSVVKELEPPRASIVETLTRVGRRNAEVAVRLMDGERVVDQWSSAEQSPRPNGRPATSELMVWSSPQPPPGTEFSFLSVPPEELPNDPVAYEGVSTLVVAAGGSPGEPQLSANSAAAVVDWVRRGGRVLLIGGARAAELIGAGAPLEELAPGVFQEVVPLPSTGVIEDYVGSDTPIPRGAEAIAAGRLKDVPGVIEVFAGGAAEEMPLVVRSLFGFGQVTYVAFDPTADEFARWSGTERLLSLLLHAEPERNEQDQQGSESLLGRAYDDLAGALHVSLGSRFAGVRSVSVMTLVGATFIYLALLGPGAYFFGLRVAGSMQSAWFTFPLIAAAVGAGAWWWGRVSTGGNARTNSAQVVDIDTQTGFERGVLFAQQFSPNAQLYSMNCQLSSTSGDAEGYLAWFGLPGSGLGGMQTPADSILGAPLGYELALGLDGMRNVPINRRASKALTARWAVNNSPVVRFELQPIASGRVEGVIVNETPIDFTQVRLIVRGWAWKLPDLPAGRVAAVDAGAAPARVRTQMLQDIDQANEARAGSPPDYLRLMLFHQALGGKTATPLLNRYQSIVDLSYAVELGHPVLLAATHTPRATLTEHGQPIDPDAQTQGVVYRFVGPRLSDQ